MKIKAMSFRAYLRTAPLGVICAGVWGMALLTPGTDASPYVGPVPPAFASVPRASLTKRPHVSAPVPVAWGGNKPTVFDAARLVRIGGVRIEGRATRESNLRLRQDPEGRPVRFHLIGARVWLASATPTPFSQTGASVWAAGADDANPPGFTNAGSIPAPPTPPAEPSGFQPPTQTAPVGVTGDAAGSASNLDNVRNEVAAGMTKSLKVAMHQWPKVQATVAGRSPPAIGRQTVTAEQGVNYVLPASGLTTNLFVTPFNNPVVITPNTHDFQLTVRGNQIFYTVTQNHPVGIFITGRNHHDPSISLTLVPRRIPAQTYFLTIPGYQKRLLSAMSNRGGTDAAIRSEMVPARPQTPHPRNTSTYVSQLTQAMRDAALGRVPPGFRKAPLSIGVVRRGPLTITGESILVGDGQSIAEFMVVNHSGQFINLVENDFWHKGVEAVSFYPKIRLIPGDSSVAIVAFQDGLHTGFGSVWRH
jgi:hypothetical protein